MIRCRTARKFSIALTIALVSLFATSAYSQAPAATPAAANPQQARPSDLEAVRAENAAIREQLKTLADTVDRLQRELEGVTPAGGATQPGPTPGTQRAERYQDGIVIWQTPDTEKVPLPSEDHCQASSAPARREMTSTWSATMNTE